MARDVVGEKSRVGRVGRVDVIFRADSVYHEFLVSNRVIAPSNSVSPSPSMSSAKSMDVNHDEVDSMPLCTTPSITTALINTAFEAHGAHLSVRWRHNHSVLQASAPYVFSKIFWTLFIT